MGDWPLNKGEFKGSSVFRDIIWTAYQVPESVSMLCIVLAWFSFECFTVFSDLMLVCEFADWEDVLVLLDLVLAVGSCAFNWLAPGVVCVCCTF